MDLFCEFIGLESNFIISNPANIFHFQILSFLCVYLTTKRGNLLKNHFFSCSELCAIIAI